MKKSSSLDKLLGAVESENKPQEKKSYVDERIWKPTMDKTGNGFAIIRFLPASEGEEMPWAKIWNHAFQGPTGQWYIENSLTTIGQNDPVSEHNSALWNSGVESDKEIARKQKRKLQYYSNIYVVKDSANPENEGKVFLYRYGKKIFDKIMETMQPAFEDETPVNPFDLWKGANFKLKLRKVDGYWNYDKSEFEAPASLLEDDDALEKVWKSQYSLKDFTDTTNFKSYDELKTRLDLVLSGTVTTGTTSTVVEMSSSFDDSPETTVTVDTAEVTPPSVSMVETDDDDDTMSYFEKLAEEN
tara:strand:+ start:450 stop:1349 length:900 start_codon:yes stop_codon:yes gene_type:complete